MRFSFALCVALTLASGFAKFQLLGTAEDRIEGKYIIGFHEDAESKQLFEDVKTNWQAHFKNEPVHLGEGLGLNYLVAYMTDEELAHAEKLPGVEFIHHDMIVKAAQLQQQIQVNGLEALDVLDGTRDNVYNFFNSGEGVDVYVLDTGIDTEHPDWAPGQAIFLADCVGANSAAQCRTGANQDPGDPQGHGSHVAGISSSPTYGVAKNSTALNVRVLGANGSGSTAGIIAGIDVVIATATGNGPRANRPAVINMSLGGGANAASNNGADRAVAAGIPTIVAAGNDAIDARLASPASAQNVVTVGSTVFTGAVSSFSNTGPLVEIFATGSNWRSLRANTDGTVVFSGTSMACPTVAGAVAQLLAADSSRTPQQITDILIDTSVATLTAGQGNIIAGTPNRFLQTNDADFFDGNMPAPNTPDDAPPQETNPPPENQPEPDSDITISTLDNFGNTFQGGTNEALSSGLMFDIVSDGTPRQVNSIAVYSPAQITNGLAVALFVEDRGSFLDPGNPRERGEWVAIPDNDPNQFVVRIDSDDQTVNVGGFTLFRNVVTLPEPVTLAANARQGWYVTLVSSGQGEFLVSDNRGVGINQATASANGVQISGANAVFRQAFGTFRDNNGGTAFAFPLLDIGLSSASANDVPSVLQRDDVRPAQYGNGGDMPIDDGLSTADSTNDNTDEFNVANGVFFDLSVNMEAVLALNVPGVFVQDFRIWLMDSLNNSDVEVYTTVNRESFMGQEGDRSAWRMIDSQRDMTYTLAGDWLNPQDQPDMPALTTDFADQFAGNGGVDGISASVGDLVESIEVAPRPEEFAFGLSLGYELKMDGTPQGFYLTFASQDVQMRVFDADMPADATLVEGTMDNLVEVSGGMGAAYPFIVSQDERQFAGSVVYGTDANVNREDGDNAANALTSIYAVVVAVVAALAALN